MMGEPPLEHNGPVHQPVLLQSVLKLLALQPGLSFVDGTLGSGGHTSAVLPRIAPGGFALGLDRDKTALERATNRITKAMKEDVEWHGVLSPFSELTRVVTRFGIEEIDRVLLDLGLSSDQLADAKRGFSFLADGPLDMRQDLSSELTAAEVVNDWPQGELAGIIFDYGGERHSRKIAGAIVEARRTKVITGTTQLAEIITTAYPGKRGKIHPATRTFQAIRMVVGNEIAELKAVLDQAPRLLSEGGRLAIITFHSLEEKLVKQCLRPFSRHGTRTDWQLNQLGRTVVPSREETLVNPRARSAKLRVYEKKMLG